MGSDSGLERGRERDNTPPLPGSHMLAPECGPSPEYLDAKPTPINLGSSLIAATFMLMYTCQRQANNGAVAPEALKITPAKNRPTR